MKHYQFYLLGEFRYLCGLEQVRTIRIAKEIGVIALLALSKDYACSRNKIIDLLWSDRCAEQGRSSLRHALWSLKKKLNQQAPQSLRVDRRRVCLDADVCNIDTSEFLTLATASGVDGLERAAAAYRGELLEDLVINDRAWEAWLAIERSRLQMIYAECLYRLSEHYLAGRDAGKLMSIGLQLVAHNSLCEAGHRALMEAYALTHQKSLALKQYERYRDLIYRELNSTPEPSILLLYRQIRDGRQAGSPVLGSGRPG